MTKKELEQLLYDNFYDKENNCIDISSLDFTRFYCNVKTANMKVYGDLLQYLQNVGKCLYQCEQRVEGNLFQSHCSVKGNLYQDKQIVEGKIYDEKTC